MFLHNHVGEVTDIKNIMIELNIYESIYNNAVTGTIVIVDTTNLSVSQVFTKITKEVDKKI